MRSCAIMPRLAFLFWVLFHGLLSQAQAPISELGLTGGVTYYLGDLNPTRHYPAGSGPAGGLVFRYNFDRRYALRLQGLYTRLQAADANSSDPVLQTRNLSFRADLIEASALVEINFFNYRGRRKDSRPWTPFVFGGLCFFSAKPKAQLNDTWYDLSLLGTEGQGTSATGQSTYRTSQIGMPFGAGFKANFGRLDLQAEWGLRRTGTDYLDDVSGRYADPTILAAENGPLAAALADRSLSGTANTGRARGDASTRDWYQYTGLTATILLTGFSDCDQQYDWMRRGR
jgi:Domain of unknown function (DUF6089)